MGFCSEYKKWKLGMPVSRKGAQTWGFRKKKKVDRDEAIWAYVMLKNGAKVKNAGHWKRIYKYLVGWCTLVDEDGVVIYEADPEIVRLHGEGVL